MSSIRILDQDERATALKGGDIMHWSFKTKSSLGFSREIEGKETVLKIRREDGVMVEELVDLDMTRSLFHKIARLMGGVANLDYRVTEDSNSMTCLFIARRR